MKKEQEEPVKEVKKEQEEPAKEEAQKEEPAKEEAQKKKPAKEEAQKEKSSGSSASTECKSISDGETTYFGTVSDGFTASEVHKGGKKLISLLGMASSFLGPEVGKLMKTAKMITLMTLWSSFYHDVTISVNQ